MVKLGVLNSRMKDFYDIWVLSQSFDFDGDQLTHAIRRTFENRSTPLPATPTVFEPSFAQEKGNQVLWQTFIRKRHREKAGTIESTHAVIKNELAGGVLPYGRFGANAAWFRLAVLTFNVLTALKRLALPAELLTAGPKQLRFLIFNTPGKLVHHARRTILRLTHSLSRFGNWHGAMRLLPLPG